MTLQIMTPSPDEGSQAWKAEPTGEPTGEPAAQPADIEEAGESESEFDFEAHRQRSVDLYRPQRQLYEDFAEMVRKVLAEALHARGIKVATLEARAKSPESFGAKAISSSQSNPSRPKYDAPLKQITDLAGVRVITFLPNAVIAAEEAIASELSILERSDKGAALIEESRFGYQSVHFLAQLNDNRTGLPEYARYAGLICEIQVRTILQHAWAEIEHDIQYKATEAMPGSVRRRFDALAGMLEIADREFEAIQRDDEDLRIRARKSVKLGKLEEVELSPDALKAYLDQRLGADRRMAEWSYNFGTTIVRRLGFERLDEVDRAIAGYDDDRISRLLWGGRRGQLTRFEGLLMAATGERFINVHPFRTYPDWVTRTKRLLTMLQQEGIEGMGGGPPQESSDSIS